MVRVITTWPGGKAGEWCLFRWPQSRGSLPLPPTRGCCWTGTHTQTDASHLQSQSQPCLVEDDRWYQRLNQFNTIMTVIISRDVLLQGLSRIPLRLQSLSGSGPCCSTCAAAHHKRAENLLCHHCILTLTLYACPHLSVCNFATYAADV